MRKQVDVTVVKRAKGQAIYRNHVCARDTKELHSISDAGKACYLYSRIATYIGSRNRLKETK